MQQNQQQQKPYQRRVHTLETQRGTVLAQIHEMRAQLIDLTVKAYAGIERRIQSKQRFIAAKWKQLLGIGMDLVAADEEIGNVWARIRLIAAGSILTTNPDNARAAAVLGEALSDPAPRVRRAALGLVAKTGGPREHEAFALLQEHVRKVSASSSPALSSRPDQTSSSGGP